MTRRYPPVIYKPLPSEQDPALQEMKAKRTKHLKPVHTFTITVTYREPVSARQAKERVRRALDLYGVDVRTVTVSDSKES